MNYYITDDISLTSVYPNDDQILVQCLSAGVIQKNTCDIPYPYGVQDARNFIELTGDRSQRFGRLMDWAIRTSDGKLIGIISFKGTVNFSKGTDEINFWLAQEFWGKGIMTDVVKGFIKLAFDVFLLRRLEVIVFESNKTSISVVQKCGFIQTDVLSDYRVKDGSPVRALKFIREKN